MGPVELGPEAATFFTIRALMNPAVALIAVACLFAFASVYYAMIGVGGGLSLYDVWYKFLPASVNWLQRYMWTSLWNGLYIILVQPAWVVVGIIGLLCIGLGKKHVE